MVCDFIGPLEMMICFKKSQSNSPIQTVQPEKFGFSQPRTLHLEPYLIDEKLELDDGCSALVLTIALHTWTAESEASVSRKIQHHLQDAFGLILIYIYTAAEQRSNVGLLSLLLFPRVRLHLKQSP